MRKQELNNFIKTLIQETLSQKYEIFVDMDGVIVDFDKQFIKYARKTPKEYEQKYGVNGFWSLIDKIGLKFWIEMPWMPKGKQLWSYIKKYNPKLLSSPSRSDFSRIGKKQWVKQNLPNIELILAYSADKQNYSGINKILIDDRKSNIEQWIEAGGIGILFTSTEQTIKELKKLGL